MGNNNRPQKTATRSISFEKSRLTQIDKEADRLGMGRSEFIEYLAMIYFKDPVLEQRVQALGGRMKR